METYPKLKAVLFDLDDTIVDSRTAEYKAICNFKKLFSNFDDIEDNEFAQIWSKITIELYDKYYKGIINFETLRIERIKKLFSNFKIKIEDYDAKEKLKIYLELYEKNWTLFSDTIDVLEKLKNKYKLAVVTNGDGIQQRKKIEKTGITKYFAEIIISSEVGFAKPDEKIFQIACKKLKVEPEECIMIGDKLDVDVAGCIKLGIKAVWINRKNENIDYKYKITQLKELLEKIIN